MLLELPSNPIIVSSATEGLYKVFLWLKLVYKTPHILLPSNACLHIVMACYHAECSYSFIDTKYESGNFDLELLTRNLSLYSFPRSRKLIIVCAHLHGIVMDMKSFREFCDQKEILIIEDCAQAILSSYQHDKTLPIGSYGDFTVYSFGATKPLSLGFGGLLLSRCSAFHDDYKHIPCSTITSEYMDTSLYRNQYYQAYSLYLDQRHKKRLHINHMQKLLECWSGYFCRSESLHSIQKIATKLSESRASAKQQHVTFDNHMTVLQSFSSKVNVVQHREADCPWRFSFLLENSYLRDQLLAYLWDLRLPANRWYPSLPDLLLPNASSFNESRRHADAIVNIPINSPDNQESLSTLKMIALFLNE